MLVDQLAKLGNVSVSQGALDALDVTFGGATLVTGTTSSATLAEADLTSLTSGKLAGLVALRDTVLPGYRASLDAVACEPRHADERAATRAGYDLNGATGIDFFDRVGHDRGDDRGQPRGRSPTRRKVAAASAAGRPGDATVALQIAGLRGATRDRRRLRPARHEDRLGRPGRAPLARERDAARRLARRTAARASRASRSTRR